VIDAKKTPDVAGGWMFRRFQRRIAGPTNSVACVPPRPSLSAEYSLAVDRYQGLQWRFQPHIWDPQTSRRNDHVEYSSPNLPPWLHWDGDALLGTPPEETTVYDLVIEARVGNPPISITLST
jgi:hypothetical protein